LRAAVKNLTNQDYLAKVALGHTRVAKDAIGRVTDSSVLAEYIAREPWLDPKDWSLLLSRITNNAALAKVALEARFSWIREAAATRLDNPILLARVGGKKADIASYAKAVANLSNSDPAIRRIAGPLRLTETDAAESVARVKLALQSPIIINRWPDLEAVFTIEGTSRTYHVTTSSTAGGQTSFSAGDEERHGADVRITLRSGSHTLAEGFWAGKYPSETPPGTIKPQDVHIEQLFSNLFSNEQVPQDYLAAVAKSEIPEIRMAAIACLSDETLLKNIEREELAREDPNYPGSKDPAYEVSRAAKERLESLASPAHERVKP